jgi:hypothetical protein
MNIRRVADDGEIGAQPAGQLRGGGGVAELGEGVFSHVVPHYAMRFGDFELIFMLRRETK